MVLQYLLCYNNGPAMFTVLQWSCNIYCATIMVLQYLLCHNGPAIFTVLQ